MTRRRANNRKQSKANSTSNSNSCCVCYEPTTNKTKCKHPICKTCLTAWLQENDSCPVCREILYMITLDIILPKFSKFVKEHHDIDFHYDKKTGFTIGETEDKTILRGVIYVMDQIMEVHQYPCAMREANRLLNVHTNIMDIAMIMS